MHLTLREQALTRHKSMLATVTPAPFLFFGCPWGMLYGFRNFRSNGIQWCKFQNVELASPEEIRFLNSGKIRIFSGLDFSGLKPIQIDGKLNSEWKIGITPKNWSTGTGIITFQDFLILENFLNFSPGCQFLSSGHTFSDCPRSEDSKTVKHSPGTSNSKS